mmetsp:Transcript_24730/g.38857  ORF Transcript_24730/g.38857 Transcript_24730/m.38857 type:complete len:543 (+) Transcript_24730:114-1742(+)
MLTHLLSIALRFFKSSTRCVRDRIHLKFFLIASLLLIDGSHGRIMEGMMMTRDESIKAKAKPMGAESASSTTGLRKLAKSGKTASPSLGPTTSNTPSFSPTDTCPFPMPDFYWLGIVYQTSDPAALDNLAEECYIRPVCYVNGVQIFFWQLLDYLLREEDPAHVPFTDYQVCSGTTFSSLPFLEETLVPDFDAILLGLGDLPVIPLFDGLDLSCPSRDCTFSGGDYQILAVAAGTFPGFGVITVPNISELNIEGFTFTGTATEEAGTYSIYLSATYGSGITIKDCTFKDITAPQVDGEACFDKGGYSAVYVGLSTEVDDNFKPAPLALDVSIEGCTFENIDTGSLPVYGLDQENSSCEACYKETGGKFVRLALIVNAAQSISMSNCTVQNVTADSIYRLSFPSQSEYNPFPCPDDGPCSTGFIADNTFSGNEVNTLIRNVANSNVTDAASAIGLTTSGNTIECDQTYLAGAYCPVYTRYVSAARFDDITANDSYPAIENTCENNTFCVDEIRSYERLYESQKYCDEFSAFTGNATEESELFD